MTEEGQEILAECVDKRVTISGVIDRKTNVYYGQRDVRTTLLQDVFLQADGKDIDLGHAWVREASALDKFPFGKRIRCQCRVTQYKKYNDGFRADGLKYVLKYGLAYPTNIEVLDGDEMDQDFAFADEIAPEVEQSTQPANQPTMGALALIVEVKKLANQAGGLDQLKALIEVLS